MKKNESSDRDKTAQASFSTTLANAAKEAARAARVAKALAAGAFALWAGSVFVAASAWFLRLEASAVGRNVALALAASLGVALLVAWRQRLKTLERRDLALAAARRLEKRFEEQKGIIVAAVDFCEETSGNATERSATTSDALREATVVAAARWYSETAAQLGAAERNALFSDCSLDLLRKIRRKGLLCGLGICANLVIWGNTAVWEERREGSAPSAEALSGENETPVVQNGENVGNREIEKKEGKEENALIANNVEKEENRGKQRAAFEREKDDVGETLSLSRLELLITEIAQNADIAEFIETELKRVAAEPNADATQLLLSARELRTNLTRPETGLVAQVRQINEIARRERLEIEERLKQNGEAENSEGPENAGINGTTPHFSQRISGKEIAVYLTLLRMMEFETDLTAEGCIGDVASLNLSRVLRSDSATERNATLSEAASRVGEWKAALRREETAARLLSESWRFDALSQRRKELVERAWQECRGALSRFAGHLTPETDATEGDKKSLEEAKRRFKTIRKESQHVERERFKIVEELGKRLRSADAREFVDFVKRETVFAERFPIESAEPDESADNALNYLASLAEEMWNVASEDVEKNRFGSAAERLERGVAELASEAETLDVETLAALLTLGFDARKDGGRRLQRVEKETVALATERPTTEIEREKSATNGEGDASTERNERRETFEAKKNNVASPPQKDGRAAEKARAKGDNSLNDDVNSDEETSWDGVVSAGLESSETVFGGEPGAENGASSLDVADVANAQGEKREEMEITENQAFSGELPSEVRRRFEGTNAPEILPEYEEKIRLYRRRILNERR